MKNGTSIKGLMTGMINAVNHISLMDAKSRNIQAYITFEADYEELSKEETKIIFAVMTDATSQKEVCCKQIGSPYAHTEYIARQQGYLANQMLVINLCERMLEYDRVMQETFTTK